MSTNHVFALLFYILKQEREREEGILSSGWEAHFSYCGAEGGKGVYASYFLTHRKIFLFRYLDTTSPRIRHSQIFHFHPNPPHRRRHAKSRQGPSWVGMGYR